MQRLAVQIKVVAQYQGGRPVSAVSPQVSERVRCLVMKLGWRHNPRFNHGSRNITSACFYGTDRYLGTNAGTNGRSNCGDVRYGVSFGLNARLGDRPAQH